MANRRALPLVLLLMAFIAVSVTAGGKQEAAASGPVSIQFAISPREVGNVIPGYLILLTGLQTIPPELYEAAEIDGAGRLARFRRITLPLLVPSILLALLFRSMDALRAFELPFALTQGGPAGSTQTLSLFGYRQFFQFLQFDSGSAVSVVQFVLILAFGLVYLRLFRRGGQ